MSKLLLIIEIGPGMGAFTKVILRKKPDFARLFAIEINPKIAEKLHQRFPSLDIALGSAESLQTMMKERQIESADAIVSGIPWALLSQAVSQSNQVSFIKYNLI